MFIECENLVKIFKLLDDVELIALQGLDVEIEEGEMVGIVGASGSGKSTLLNVLGGLIRPTAGAASVNGRSLLKMSENDLDKYRRDEVGFVWQQSTRNLIPWLNAVENVEYPMLMAGKKRAVARQRATDLLKMVNLEDRLTHRPEMMSGGEQSRVAIAIALANNPSLLLADEPTGELDTATALVIYDLFKTLNKELNLTTLIVSHDPGIARHVDRVILIRDGKLAGETVRSQPQPNLTDANSPEQEETFEELIVLDNTGRLQIPQAMRDELGLERRVRLEQTAEGVLIRPVENRGVQVENSSTSAAPIPQEKEQTGKLRRWLRGDQL
ncbi:MAG: ABC-type lipoprotein export system ATPase subunit [Cellvibrionaceae bacterium]|jgi:ABC-type lipoprotein export system ATPase subunit/bifunctional DNA-binding transcriptional regulator/antitoxin component of YhaV-PrlF toxin-antitoxin module